MLNIRVNDLKSQGFKGKPRINIRSKNRHYRMDRQFILILTK